MWKSPDCADAGVYIDCTLGGGGHSAEILKRGGRVIAIDQDQDAIDIVSSTSHMQRYIEENRMEIHKTNFRNLRHVVNESKFVTDGLVDGIIMDLGVSSHQIDEASRGFAFGQDGPLDMRMAYTKDISGEIKTLSAYDIVNEWDEVALANLLYQYGDETNSRRLAKEIVASRPLKSTGELEKLISRLTPFKHRNKTLARCFQAIRIAVNDELGALEDALKAAEHIVRPGGRLVIMSYHSLEDRRVKQLFKTGKIDISTTTNRDRDTEGSKIAPWGAVLRKAISASDEEVLLNRRARSAKLRVGERADELGKTSIMRDKTSSKKYGNGFLGKKEALRLL